MSTYYYLVCHEHRCTVGVASSVGGGSALYSLPHVPRFVYIHRNCTLQVIDEHKEVDLITGSPPDRYIRCSFTDVSDEY